MDVLAHTLWTNALFHLKYKKLRKMRYLAAFFGVAPDLIGFTPMFFYLIIFARPLKVHESDLLTNPHWTFEFAKGMYNYSHSLVIFAAVFGLVLLAGNIYYRVTQGRLFRVWFFWPLLGWGLHILIDIPTHPEFYQTPLFFPLSDLRNGYGVSWNHPVFMAVNYSLLAVAYLIITLYQRKKYGFDQISHK